MADHPSERQLPHRRSFRFTQAITRRPAKSVSHGLREGAGPDPDAALFGEQHRAYVAALEKAGAEVVELPELEEFPDSVFVEDTTICIGDTAIVVRPGAPSRFGECEQICPTLKTRFTKVIDLPGDGFLDGGDVLLSDDTAFIGNSGRTNMAGLVALATLLKPLGYNPVQVNTPADILHFKTECGLLDERTIFATVKLASLGCFEGFRVIETPLGEEAAANIVRYNDVVFLSAGYPKSEALLREKGYDVVILDTSEAAKVDGGLSCMSLRF